MKWMLALSLLSASAAASAQVTYDYTGNPFTLTAPIGPYTTEDRVTASVVFAAPLAANLSLATETPESYLLYDGVQTLTSANSTLEVFQFSTNAAGAITGWDVQAAAASGGFLETENFLQVPLLNFAEDLGHSNSPDLSSGNNFDSPGVWTEQTATAAPELDPGSTGSALTLLAGALLLRLGQRVKA